MKHEYIWYIVVAVVCFSVAASARADVRRFTKQELACFAKVDDPAFEPAPIEGRFRTIRGLRRCKNRKTSRKQFECIQQDRRVRRNKNVLQVVFDTDAIDSYVHFANMGWDRDNTAILRKDYLLPDALLIARGVDNTDVGDTKLEIAALLDHMLFVEEVQCIRKTRKCKKLRKKFGFCETSFDEVQKIFNR